jgi:hypothetical protein
MDQKQEEAAACLSEARAAMGKAYVLMHAARAKMEDLRPGTDAFVNHQSDSGALWALAAQIDEMRKTTSRIIKGLRGTR